jgi:hypothetical protein
MNGEDISGVGTLTATDVTVSGTVDAGTVSADELNNTIHVKQTETLNDAISRSPSPDGPGTLVLPEDVTTFTSSIDFLSRSQEFVIQGRGKGTTTLQSDGSPGLLRLFNDRPDASLILRDLTLDMNNVASPAETLLVAGAFEALELDNVRLINVDLSNQSSSNGIFEIRASLGSLVVSGRSEILGSTFSNFQDEVLMVANTPGAGDVDRLFVGAEVYHKGEYVRKSAGSNARFQGYSLTINERADVLAHFDGWEQYAAWIIMTDTSTHAELKPTVREAGEGDILRVSETGGGGHVTFGGAILNTNPDAPTSGNSDRGYIVQSGAPHVSFDNAICQDINVGCEIRGCQSLTGEIKMIDTGDNDSTGGAPGLQINDKDGTVDNIHLNVEIDNNNPDRPLEPAIEIDETAGNFASTTHVISGFARGFETNQITDNTAAGVTIDTSDLI